MAEGIIYIMTTIVPGLIKIGKTGTDNFEQRMYNLEHNGYANVVGLKRAFAIKVEDYDDKEVLLHNIFSKSNVPGTELFALDINLVTQLLSSFDGKQIYPKDLSKEEVFEEATNRRDSSVLPEGTYYMNRKVKAWGNKEVKGTMQFKDGKFIVKKGSILCPIRGKGWTSTKQIDDKRASAVIINDILQEDVEFTSPSLAASFISYLPTNGWDQWKDSNGNAIDVYRKEK
ncbi:MAG: DUF4357 domain-containing protein [Erysipelotrichaceae bacterium]|nr:DUF4357 domain-containing protein [Erysipelotrichaceae bacterium]